VPSPAPTQPKLINTTRPWNGAPPKLIDKRRHYCSIKPPAQCAAILPRLQEIANQPQGRSTDPLLQRHKGDARQLLVVLQLCIEKDVDLLFG
jgi:hypothetical protein